MNKIKIVTTLLTLLLFSGCTNKNYYEPEKIADDISFNDGSIKDIIKTNRDIIQLEDGSLITNEVIKFKLKENERVLNYDKIHKQISVLKDDFTLSIYNLKGDELFSKKFEERTIVATMQNSVVALVTATNKVVILDSSKVTYSQKFDKAYAINSRVAAPIFSNNIVAVPTLDGRLVIVKSSGELLQSYPISSQKNFNNIIFLKNLEKNIIVATPSKIVALYGSQTKSIKEQIKEVVAVNDNIYIFTNDGKVIKTDSSLNKLATKKYKFAIFARAGSDGEYLYALEKTGFLIVSDLDLEKDVVYETSSIDADTFINNDHIFYDDDFLNLKNIIKP